MNKSIWTITKINLKNINVPYFVTGVLVFLMLVQIFIMILVARNGEAAGNVEISLGCYLWLLPAMAAIFIPAKNFRRTINLGGKRGNFFWGSLATYAILAAVVSLANVLIHYAFDSVLEATGYYDTETMGGVVNMVEVFGWISNGALAAFFQQFAFLFLFAAFTHTLTAAQDKWYGWAADVAIVSIISVFTPITPLRAALAWFFNLIIFHQNALLQIVACIVLAAAIYALNKPILARKAI